MTKDIIVSGKRKTAVARAALREGTGKVRINKMPLAEFGAELYRLRIEEPLLLAADVAGKVDLDIAVSGGGPMSQSDAVRSAIAKAISEYAPKYRAVFLGYDRQLLVADVRLKETRKPNRHGKARSKKQKSYR